MQLLEFIIIHQLPFPDNAFTALHHSVSERNIFLCLASELFSLILIKENIMRYIILEKIHQFILMVGEFFLNFIGAIFKSRSYCKEVIDISVFSKIIS